MPLDSSLFLQGAALNNQNNQQLLNSIQGGIDNAMKMKALNLEKQKAGFDIEKLAGAALLKSNMGIELTAQDTAALKAFDALETRKLAQDPTGNYRRINASLFDNLSFPGASTQPSAPNLAGVVNPPPLGSRAQGSNPAITTPYDQIKPELGFNTEAFSPQNVIVPPSIEENPNAKQKYLESYAGKTGEKAAETQGKGENIDNIITSIEGIIKTVPQTPSGAFQSFAAKAGNFAGYPNPQAEAQAEIEGTIPILLGQVKNFIRSKGEGTFSDKDQALLDRMLPKDTDSVPVKLKKLQAVSDEFKRIKSGGNIEAPKATSWEDYFR